MTKRIIPILFLSLALLHNGQAAGNYTYQISSRVSVPVKATEYVECTKEVKVRSKGRWVYKQKKSKCATTVENWHVLEVTGVFRADTRKKAIKEAIEFYKDKGYKYLKLLMIKKI